MPPNSADLEARNVIPKSTYEFALRRRETAFTYYRYPKSEDRSSRLSPACKMLGKDHSRISDRSISYQCMREEKGEDDDEEEEEGEEEGAVSAMTTLVEAQSHSY